MLSFIIGKWIKKDNKALSAKTSNQKSAQHIQANHKTATIEELVSQAREDDNIRNQLIDQYKPFIAKVASKVCKQYIDTSRDEFSVALEAYNEAINHYQEGQGSAFLSFAEMVIRRRVIDYLRKETRQTRDIFLESESNEDDIHEESMAQVSASINQYKLEQESERRRADILEYQEQLAVFSITFSDLAELCPKHIDARENAKQIAKFLASESDLVRFLMEKKQLPMKELLKSVDCSRKTLERNRKYIIAMALIYIGNYVSLRSYIEPEQDTYGKEGQL